MSDPKDVEDLGDVAEAFARQAVRDAREPPAACPCGWLLPRRVATRTRAAMPAELLFVCPSCGAMHRHATGGEKIAAALDGDGLAPIGRG